MVQSLTLHIAAEPLTEEEEEERRQLYTKGYSHWSKKDFSNFINACAKFGRYV